MSFRDIGVIINKWKERERGQLDENDDIKSKSKTTQAIKLFSEGKTTVDVVIALNLPADHVWAIYRQYWDLKHMYELGQIYDEAEYDLHKLLRLHKIVKGLGMEEHDVINVLELAKNNQLGYLQWKVEYLRNDIDMLEDQKTKASNHILMLNRRIDEFQGMLSIHESSLPHKREEMTYMNQESGTYDNIDNLYPIPYSGPDASSYSIRLSYLPMNDYRGDY